MSSGASLVAKVSCDSEAMSDFGWIVFSIILWLLFAMKVDLEGNAAVLKGSSGLRNTRG